MLARFTRVLVVAPLLAMAALACTSTGATSGASLSRSAARMPLTPTSRLIGAEQIARSGVETALDVIRVFVPNGHLAVASSPMARLTTPSMSRGVRQVLVDGHAIGDLESLRMIPAREVLAIHLLSGADASIRFGPHFGGGAIVVETIASLRPR